MAAVTVMVPVEIRSSERAVVAGCGVVDSRAVETGSCPSFFEQILALACDRIDTLRGFQPEVDRRGISRRRTAFPALCTGEWGDSPCLISDLSEGGLAFVCGHLHEIGDCVHIDWNTPRGGKIRLDGIVRHITGPYIGIEFLQLTRQKRREISASLTVIRLHARESKSAPVFRRAVS